MNKIDKGIPMPGKTNWSEFEVGDSMEVKNYGASSNAKKHCQLKGLDWEWSTRMYEGKLRIWRIK